VGPKADITVDRPHAIVLRVIISMTIIAPRRALAFDEISEHLRGGPLKVRFTPQKARVTLHQTRERLVRADLAIIIVGSSHRCAKLHFFVNIRCPNDTATRLQRR
jgi:hypothetical protein